MEPLFPLISRLKIALGKLLFMLVCRNNEDHETALSAVRNLNGVDVGGRPLRIDLADSDPFLEGKTTVRGELLDSGYPGPSEPRSRGGPRSDLESFLSNLPSGKPIPPGSSALDSISHTLADMSPSQLMEVLAQMKAFVITHPDQARTLLVKHPQLSYALFQALLLNKIVDSAILERMLASSRGSSSAAVPTPAAARPVAVAPTGHQHAYPPVAAPVYPAHMPPFPPQQPPISPVSAMFSQAYYHLPASATVPTQAAVPAVGSAAAVPGPKTGLPEISDSQRAMLMQVLSLSQDQINALAETERAAIMHLRSQFMGTLSTTS